MLGHLKPRRCQLSTHSKQHYQQLYCSLCFSLRQQFGLPASFLINHELTLSLAAFSTTQTLAKEQRACPAQLFCGQKTIVRDALVDKAARLCLLLVWLKLTDSDIDQPAWHKKALKSVLQQKVQGVLKELSPATQQFIDSYIQLIRANQDFSHTAKMSGLLAKQVFQELAHDADYPIVADITLSLGELITLADALLDVQADLTQQQYNPIIEASAKNHSPLATEYLALQNDYLALVERIKQQLNDDSINPLFKELLQQSLKNLTAKIYRANQALFAEQTDRTQRRRSRQRNRNNQNNAVNDDDGGACQCFDCCDCADCCDCCSDCHCCGNASDSSCGCCECHCDGCCCDCGS